MSAEYAALIRAEGVDTVPICRIYLTALTFIRSLLRDEGLDPEARLAEVSDVLIGLKRVQEELDLEEQTR